MAEISLSHRLVTTRGSDPRQNPVLKERKPTRQDCSDAKGQCRAPEAWLFVSIQRSDRERSGERRTSQSAPLSFEGWQRKDSRLQQLVECDDRNRSTSLLLRAARLAPSYSLYPSPTRFALMACSSFSDSANWAFSSVTSFCILSSKGSPSSATSSAPT